MSFHSEEAAAFIRRLCSTGRYRGPEQRQHPRHRVVMPVQVTPCDMDNKPTGDTYTAITKDISVSGISLLHHRKTSSSRLHVRLASRAGTEMTLVMQILRCRQIGPYYEIAGDFVANLNEPKAPEVRVPDSERAPSA